MGPFRQHPFGRIIWRTRRLVFNQSGKLCSGGGYLYEGSASGTVTFNVSPTSMDPDVPIDTVVAAPLTPRQVQHYGFTLILPATLLLDSLTNRSDLYWSEGPGGNLVNNRPSTVRMD